MTVQLYPTFTASTNPQAASPNNKPSVEQTFTVSDAPHQISATGSGGVPSARVTSAGGGSASGTGSAAGGIPTRTSSGNRAPAGAAGHARNISTVSSTGASPEYEEDDLDEDWRTLLDEVNGLLASRNYSPIRNARCAAAMRLHRSFPSPHMSA